ncbi:hypothetical protein HYX19_01695 [Candidatus Woesearchaeota archaeon]|nr:hypothetical protein [Candidatus Woesearchaeota archaeon]
MKKLILCQICEKNTANNTCEICGLTVCDYDYDKESGLCVSCKRGKRI